jgi:hypothetical protein
VLGPLGGTPQVVLTCGFSGHGFKFVPVVGEIVADLVQTGTTPHDIALFDVARPAFAGTRGPSRPHVTSPDRGRHLPPGGHEFSRERVPYRFRYCSR